MFFQRSGWCSLDKFTMRWPKLSPGWNFLSKLIELGGFKIPEHYIRVVQHFEFSGSRNSHPGFHQSPHTRAGCWQTSGRRYNYCPSTGSDSLSRISQWVSWFWWYYCTRLASKFLNQNHQFTYGFLQRQLKLRLRKVLQNRFRHILQFGIHYVSLGLLLH